MRAKVRQCLLILGRLVPQLTRALQRGDVRKASDGVRIASGWRQDGIRMASAVRRDGVGVASGCVRIAFMMPSG